MHLSESESVAISVGVRYGKAVLLKVSSGEMHRSGFSFYRSANHVWLVDAVPPEYLTVIEK